MVVDVGIRIFQKCFDKLSFSNEVLQQLSWLECGSFTCVRLIYFSNKILILFRKLVPLDKGYLARKYGAGVNGSAHLTLVFVR